MKTNFKPWLFGLIQATAVVCFSFVLYIAFSYIVRFNFSKSLDSLLLTTISALGFVFALLTYALIVMSRPVYLFVSKKPLEGIKTVAYTAVFLFLILAVIEAIIYFFVPNRFLSERGILISPDYPMSQDEAIHKAQQSKERSEEARLEYELEEKTKTPPTAIIKDINTAGQMYPYVIDINTGEQTPIANP